MERIVLGWLLYALWGLISALLQGEEWNAPKFVKSILWAVLVSMIALFTGLPPELVVGQYEHIIMQILVFVVNSGPVIALIWWFDRLYGIIMGIRENINEWFKTK